MHSLGVCVSFVVVVVYHFLHDRGGLWYLFVAFSFRLEWEDDVSVGCYTLPLRRWLVRSYLM